MSDSILFSSLFVALIVITSITRLWLSRRHIQHVTTQSNKVPKAFADSIDLTAHQKAAQYTVAKSKLVMLEIVIQAFVLLGFTLGGGLQFIDSVWQNWLSQYEILRGALVICSALLISSLIDLPFEYYKTFKVDERFGFNKMTPSMFFTDLVKHSIVGVILGAPLLFAALWLMQSAGSYWWFYLWIVWSAFNLTMLALYPTFIAPLFNKFSPLDDLNLKGRVEALLTKCGLPYFYV